MVVSTEALLARALSKAPKRPSTRFSESLDPALGNDIRVQDAQFGLAGQLLQRLLIATVGFGDPAIGSDKVRLRQFDLRVDFGDALTGPARPAGRCRAYRAAGLPSRLRTDQRKSPRHALRSRAGPESSGRKKSH